MKISNLKLLQFASLASLLLLVLLLHTSTTFNFNSHPIFFFFLFLPSLLYYRLSSRSGHPILLLNYSSFKPHPSQKCTLQDATNFILQTPSFSPESVEFILNIYLKSGLSDETYTPRFVSDPDHIKPNLRSAMQEAQEGIFSSINSLLSKTDQYFDPSLINILIVTSGSFSSPPSLSSLIVNQYNLNPDVKSYNLTGMGCSSGVIAIDLAAKVLQESRKVGYALVVLTECITSNWYNGNNRSMLLTNCIFRVGSAALLITNDPSQRRVAKMELVNSLRTHHGANDESYRAAIQEEDENGITGISLTKDLIRIAGMHLRDHIKILAPRFLPWSQIFWYGYNLLAVKYSTLFPRGDVKPFVPDLTTAFDHFCIHTGGKAVIETVGRVLRLGDEITEPARMTLHRFGNTSSSLVVYELGYLEAKKRMKKGDKVWMLAFGTGFKVGSLIWKVLADSCSDSDNPWNDCIHSYPLKSW